LASLQHDATDFSTPLSTMDALAPPSHVNRAFGLAASASGEDASASLVTMCSVLWKRALSGRCLGHLQEFQAWSDGCGPINALRDMIREVLGHDSEASARSSLLALEMASQALEVPIEVHAYSRSWHWDPFSSTDISLRLEYQPDRQSQSRANLGVNLCLLDRRSARVLSNGQVKYGPTGSELRRPLVELSTMDVHVTGYHSAPPDVISDDGGHVNFKGTLNASDTYKCMQEDDRVTHMVQTAEEHEATGRSWLSAWKQATGWSDGAELLKCQVAEGCSSEATVGAHVWVGHWDMILRTTQPGMDSEKLFPNAIESHRHKRRSDGAEVFLPKAYIMPSCIPHNNGSYKARRNDPLRSNWAIPRRHARAVAIEREHTAMIPSAGTGHVRQAPAPSSVTTSTTSEATPVHPAPLTMGAEMSGHTGELTDRPSVGHVRSIAEVEPGDVPIPVQASAPPHTEETQGPALPDTGMGAGGGDTAAIQVEANLTFDNDDQDLLDELEAPFN
jgi:hypothetical protein